MTIEYVVGDATQPWADGLKIIAHVCNDAGRWGAGFTDALSRRWIEAERAYRNWFVVPQETPFRLGETQFVTVAPGLSVANMIAQVRPGSRPVPLDYPALERCLSRMAAWCWISQPPVSVHMPRIGCGLAGGEWSKVEPLIRKTLTDRGVKVVVYDLDRELVPDRRTR